MFAKKAGKVKNNKNLPENKQLKIWVTFFKCYGNEYFTIMIESRVITKTSFVFDALIKFAIYFCVSLEMKYEIETKMVKPS